MAQVPQEVEFIVRQTREIFTNQGVQEIQAGGWLIDDDRKFTVLYRLKLPAAPAAPNPPVEEPSAPVNHPDPLRLAIVGAVAPDDTPAIETETASTG